MTGYRLIVSSDVATRLCRDVKQLKVINGDIDAEYEALVAEYATVSA